MKTLCITGANTLDLNFVQGLLSQSGVALALPASRESTLSIDFWHEQVQARMQELADESGEIELGRVWEQLASDIFVANFEQKVWGWANVHSLPVLDFWQAFDTQVRFVLVTCTVQRHVAQALEQGMAVNDVPTSIANWVSQHLQMLQFYHRNPQKTVLVDIEHCISNPAGLIKSCQQSWQLDLSKVHFPEAPAPEVPTLLRFMSDRLCETNTQWLPLQNEISNSLTPIITLWHKSNQVDVNQLVKAYRDERDHHNQAQQASAQALVDQSQVLEKERANFEHKSKELIDTARVKSEEQDALQEKIHNAEEENDLILAQLHQVQEELENYFLKYQDTKEELESSDKRWKRMLARIPDYFDLGEVNVTLIEVDDVETLQWHLKDLDAAGRLTPELTVNTSIEGGVACLTIPRQCNEKDIFLRWPAAAGSDQSLTIAVVGDTKTGPKRLDMLLQIGRSDWDFVQVIINVLSQSLQNPESINWPKSVSTDNTKHSLLELKLRLAELPPVFRFDEISLKREQVNPDYEHLWLDFKHVSMGSKRLLDFDFRVSCANVRPNSFGEYPKLEFPEASGRAAITNWFDESYDDFGAKLELRFSLPQSIDMQVWNQLSKPDQSFLFSLVEQIPALFTELEILGANVKRGWKGWQQLAFEMRRILASCTRDANEDVLVVEKSIELTKQQSKKPSTRSTNKTKTMANA